MKRASRRRAAALQSGSSSPPRSDADWLAAAARLAARGRPLSRPNPSVGCIVVKDGVVRAPPPSSLMLTGITYDVVLELAAAHDIPHEVRAIAEAEVRGADELWMTSSTKEIMAIVALDGVLVGAGVPGPLAMRMDALYQTFKQQVMRS